MTRRSLLGMLAACVVAPFAPKVAPVPTPQRLVFHPDAFALVMESLNHPTRLDVLYGFATISNQQSVRIMSD